MSVFNSIPSFVVLGAGACIGLLILENLWNATHEEVDFYSGGGAPVDVSKITIKDILKSSTNPLMPSQTHTRDALIKEEGTFVILPPPKFDSTKPLTLRAGYDSLQIANKNILN